MLVARAPTVAGAEALALELALPRLSDSPELASARDGRRESWAATLLRGPVSTLTPAGDCAARLRGWAEAWRAVAAGAAPPVAPRDAEGVPPPGRASLPHTEGDVPRLAIAANPAGLEGALQREARLARAQLFSRIGALPSGAREVAADSWRRAWWRRAAELDTIAQALAALKPRLERELIARVAPAHALEAEPRIPDPGVVLLLAASGAEPVSARPYLPTWIFFAGAGSVLALLITAPLTRSAIRGRRARHDDLMRRLEAAGHAFAAIPPLASATIDARLQIVSGTHSRRVAHATRELAARFVAEGERVLVMDGGRHTRLHDSFGAQPRLGFQECMRVDLPLLGVVQSGGLPGLYVLAHGAPSRLRTWIPLGRLLDQARPYFSRVLLAVDPHVSRQAGEALAGRLMDGWWAGKDVHTSRAARRFSTRLGVPLQAIEPSWPENASVEALVGAITKGRRRREVAPVAAWEEWRPSEPEPATAAENAAASAAPDVEPAPTVEIVASSAAPDAEPAPAAVESVARPAPLHEPAALEAMLEEFMRDVASDSGVETATLDEMVHELERASAAAAQTAAPEPAAHAPEPEVHAPDPPIEPAAADDVAPAYGLVAYESAPEPAPSALAPSPEMEPAPVPEFAPAAEMEPVAAPELAPAAEHESAPESAPETEFASAAPAPELEFAPEPESAPASPADLAATEPVLGPADMPASEPPAALAAAPSAAVGAGAGEPVVLESDPEVHERLRFLVWMRRLRDKSRGEVTHAG